MKKINKPGNYFSYSLILLFIMSCQSFEGSQPLKTNVLNRLSLKTIQLRKGIEMVSLKENSTLLSENIFQDVDTTEWIAPASADEMTNPIASDEESIEEGSMIYRKHCRSCHGRDGDGNGVQAKELSTEVGDFTDPAVFEQSDGSLFWKISEGRNSMESYKKKLMEEDIWYVINYIKTFSKKSDE